MDKKTKTIIIIGSIITFLVVPTVTIFLLTKNDQKTATQHKTSSTTKPLPNRSNDELTKAITAHDASLLENDKPIFTITKVVKPDDGWYVVTMLLNSDTEGTNPARVLLHDSASTGLTLLLGPGTSFPSDATQPLGIPSTVLKELNR